MENAPDNQTAEMMKKYLFFSVWKTPNATQESCIREVVNCVSEEKVQRFADWITDQEQSLARQQGNTWLCLNCKIIE